MDYPVYHLATISCVWWHVIGVLIVVRVCFRNWWMDRGIWKKQKTKREMDINHFFSCYSKHIGIKYICYRNYTF